MISVQCTLEEAFAVNNQRYDDGETGKIGSNGGSDQ